MIHMAPAPMFGTKKGQIVTNSGTTRNLPQNTVDTLAVSWN
jgi:hypothetical protein